MAKIHLPNRFSQFNLGTRLGVYLISLFSLIYLFESKSGLDEIIEQHFYNFRTVHKPPLPSPTKTTSVIVSSKDILPYINIEQATISVKGLQYIYSSIQKLSPKRLILILPFNTAPYADPEFSIWLEKISNSKVSPFIGVMNSLDAETGLSNLKNSIRSKIISASLAHTSSKNSVLQSFPIYNFKNSKLDPTIITATSFLEMPQQSIEGFNHKTASLVKQLESDTNSNLKNTPKTPYLKLTLNYRGPGNKNHLDFAQIEKSQNKLKNQIVVVGVDLSKVKEFKSRNKRARESFYSNTPWSDSSAEASATNGLFYSDIIAQAIDNTISGTSLSKTNLFFNLLALGFMVFFSIYVWKFTMEKAAFLIIGAHSAYYVFNLISFSYLSLYPDIARVITYSAIATVIGAFIRSQRSFENRIAIELRTDSQKELSNIHNKFLNLLSKGLRDQNRRIAQKVRELIHLIPNIEKDTEELLENAASGADELGEYLDGLAEYAEIENHKLKEPNKSNINLFELLTSVSKQCHPSKRNISVEINGDRDLIVNSDFVYLKSVTYNLISNAIKYSPEGYKVTVKITEKKDFFQVDIIDFGPGIPNDLKDRIFEKFYRIKDDRAFTSKGTGLGLYLTKYFAEIIGCTILVKDNTPNGSVFVLKIPKGVNK